MDRTGRGAGGFEERVAERVTKKLLATIYHVEMDRAWRKESSDLTARDLTTRALSYSLIQDLGSAYQGLEVASKAMEWAPDDPLPAALAAQCHARSWSMTLGPPAEREAARDRALRTAQLRSRDATAEAVLADTFILLGDLVAADIHIERALALDGGCAWAWYGAGIILICRGLPEAGMERLRISEHLDSSGMLPMWTMNGFGLARFEAGHHNKAARCWQRVLAENPTWGWLNKFLGPAMALLGRKDEARAHLHGMRNFRPDWEFNLSNHRKVMSTSETFNDQLANGWESIGVRPVQ
jgi:tetratricopeptide (TPR) repeat protein